MHTLALTTISTLASYTNILRLNQTTTIYHPNTNKYKDPYTQSYTNPHHIILTNTVQTHNTHTPPHKSTLPTLSQAHILLTILTLSLTYAHHHNLTLNKITLPPTYLSLPYQTNYNTSPTPPYHNLHYPHNTQNLTPILTLKHQHNHKSPITSPHSNHAHDTQHPTHSTHHTH